jgi:electron transfer flavoprotein beta subunit
MKIIVCVKGVTTSATGPLPSEDGSGIISEGDRFINGSDDYALELALSLKRSVGAHVTAITVGSIRSQDVLHVAVAKGADEVLRVDSEEFDPNIVSLLLASAIRTRDYDLILSGVESADGMTSQVGTSVGARLDLPYLYAVTKVEAGVDGAPLTVHRELGGGRFQVLEVTKPALLCVQSGVVPLTYAPVVKLIHARRRGVPALGLAELAIEESALAVLRKTRITAIKAVAKSSSTQWLSGNPQELARQIVQKIAEAM